MEKGGVIIVCVVIWCVVGALLNQKQGHELHEVLAFIGATLFTIMVYIMWQY